MGSRVRGREDINFYRGYFGGVVEVVRWDFLGGCVYVCRRWSLLEARVVLCFEG